MKSAEILRNVVETIDEVRKRIDSLKNLSDRNKKKALVLLEEARNNFLAVADNVVEDNEELANFFLKRVVRLKNSTNDKFIEKFGQREYMSQVSTIARYSKVAPYDFSGDVRNLQKAYRAFLFGMIPFYIISGIFGPVYAITALILVIPTLLSMLSLRKRGSIGLMLAFAVMPIPMVMGAFSVRYAVYALSNSGEIMKIAHELGKSPLTAQILVLIIGLLGGASIVLLSYASYMLYRHRHAFL
ncbi:alpha-glucosidase [Thermococcus sp.]